MPTPHNVDLCMLLPGLLCWRRFLSPSLLEALRVGYFFLIKLELLTHLAILHFLCRGNDSPDVTFVFLLCLVFQHSL